MLNVSSDILNIRNNNIYNIKLQKVMESNEETMYNTHH